ncbi:DUF1697 domain-containing protein [Paenibacillus ginsengarvi]|uniref:DUF1697 domain-containing protein n=1 Tax=Paenibacillus ginsengarvi TaxID=400777 RepID=A0A3B0CDR2_9BACL|nr:DUF1697 domain-containing protein [Paenibacillus ginsengarvi]RKN82149.1 DUF1697 domain-containing protein [Paenibacillus ginsengarvi]
MAIYIALLRGINVSGQKLIKMDRLKEMFETMPVRNVRTYIQSGNVVFTAEETDTERLRLLIESKLREALGYGVDVVVRTKEELERAIAGNPFGGEEAAGEAKLYVSFLSGEPEPAAAERLASLRSEVDEYRLIGCEAYILCRERYGQSLFSNNFLEKKLGVLATTRNWRTVNKLAAMAAEQ